VVKSSWAGVLPGMAIIIWTLFLYPNVASGGGDVGVVAARLAQYADSFPQIHFVHLQRPGDITIVEQLPAQLGDYARNMDYEHESEARQWLLDAQLSRIKLMVRNDIPSATLFKTGTESLYSTRHVCIITLNESAVREDELSASRFMAGIGKDSPLVISGAARLDNTMFLLFTLDHEIFHCLNAYLHGPTYKKTRSKLKGSYHQFLGEYGADFFATLAARRFNSADRRFMQNFMQYRALSLTSFDVPHYTSAAIAHALGVPEDRIHAGSLVELARLARSLSDATVPSLQGYEEIFSASYRLALMAGNSREDLADRIAGISATAPTMRALDSSRRVIHRAQTFIFRDNSSSGG